MRCAYRGCLRAQKAILPCKENIFVRHHVALFPIYRIYHRKKGSFLLSLLNTPPLLLMAMKHRRKNHCSDDMNEATLQIESPSTATSTTTTAQVLPSALMDNPPSCDHLQPTADYLDSVTARFLQPQLSAATTPATAPGSNCSSMLITDEPMGEIPSDIERVHAGGYPTGDSKPR